MEQIRVYKIREFLYHVYIYNIRGRVEALQCRERKGMSALLIEFGYR